MKLTGLFQHIGIGADTVDAVDVDRHRDVAALEFHAVSDDLGQTNFSSPPEVQKCSTSTPAACAVAVASTSKAAALKLKLLRQV